MDATNQSNDTSGTRSLYGLYYPETICLNELYLKYLILIYDKIFFLPVDIEQSANQNSLSRRFSIKDGALSAAFKSRKEVEPWVMYSSEPGAWDNSMKRLMELYDEYEEKGVLVGLSNEAISSSSAWHPLQPAVDADLTDESFVVECKRLENKDYQRPPVKDGKIKGGGFSIRPMKYKGSLATPSICSERINTALYMADQHNCIPVTPDNLFIRLLNCKLQRISTSNLERKVSKPQKYSLLSWELMTTAIPQNLMESKSLHEIIRYKNALGEPNNRFRDYLFSLESAMENEPWDEKFIKELNSLVNGKILPDVRKLRDEKTEIWEKLFGQAVKSVATVKVGAPIVTLMLYPGITFMEIVAYSTSIVSGAVMPALTDAWQEERRHRRNALFFLMNFPKR